MARRILRQQSIWGGISSSYEMSDSEYTGGVGIDPDVDMGGVLPSHKTSGMISPVSYTKFSGSDITSSVIAIITNPKNTLIYTIQTNGKLTSYSSTFASETAIGTVTGGNATGGAYYNNYIYIFGTGAGKNDVSRYGPLTSSPALANAVWSDATLGSQTLNTNTVYPTVFGALPIHNHWGHVHRDGALYWCDFATQPVGTSGKGVIHRIKTVKVTDEGDTNDGSGAAVLSLPYGYYPTDIETYGLDLVISAIQTTEQGGDAILRQGDSALFFWDTTSDSFYTRVPVPQPYVSALLNKNGVIFAFGGSVSGAVVYQYGGGGFVSQVQFHETSASPYQGAVDAANGRLTYGGTSIYPTTTGVPNVFTIGSKDEKRPSGLHSTIRTTSSGSNGFVTALKYVQQLSNRAPRPLVAWKDGTTQGIDRLQSRDFDANQPIWRSKIFHVGRKFEIKSVRFQTAVAASATHHLLLKIFIDNEVVTSSSITIGGTGNEFIGSSAFLLKYPQLKMSDGSAPRGRINFMLHVEWFSTGDFMIHLPIDIEIEEFEDEATGSYAD